MRAKAFVSLRYRVDNADEIVNIGYEEFLYGDGVAVVEWAEKLGTSCPKNICV